MVRNFLINNFPQLGKYKRYFRAFRSKISKSKKSYSQHKEDMFFLEELKTKGFNSQNSIYIDIGANHPSDLSNTYLLYRNSFNGILIDANKELCMLCEKFRPNDIVLNIGASDKTSIMDFYISKTPVLSTFDQHDEYHDRRLYRKYRIPVLRVDDAVENLIKEKISLLSIDVESLNLEVLRGCYGILNNTYILCVEYDNQSDKEKYLNCLKDFSFEEIEDNGCNVIYKNKELVTPDKLNEQLPLS